MRGEVLDGVGLHMSHDDNVVTAIDDIDAGMTIPYDGADIEVAESVPFGHKIALVELTAGEEVLKYGEVIGRATERIAPGEWVHTHNCESNRGRGDIADTEEEVA